MSNEVRYLEGPLIQEGDELAKMRREARAKITTRARSNEEAAMFIAMLGIGRNTPLDDKPHTPLSSGWDDRAQAAKRRRYYAQAATRSA